MSENGPEEIPHELARTMAKVQYRYSEAIEELAVGSVDTADYRLLQAWFTLGDYLNEGDWKTVPVEEGER